MTELDSNAKHLTYLVETRRFPEVLYLGALQITARPSAHTHLCLGLACCGSIKPIAAVERTIAAAQAKGGEHALGCIVGRGTTLVYDGLHHLHEATRLEPTIHFSEKAAGVVKEVIEDLGYYLCQEFHGISRKGRRFHFTTAAAAAIIKLARIARLSDPLPERAERLRHSGEELLDSLNDIPEPDATFYPFLRTTHIK